MIFVIIGKSASGKDRIYREILSDPSLGLEPFVIYTTRPMRAGEENGREYHFTDAAHLETLRRAGKVIEERVYPTVHGDWYYFTADDGQTDPDKNYLGIGTLESFVRLKQYYGAEAVCPLYIECDDRLRLLRSVERERSQEMPEYKEVCRRYLADEDDFSEEKINKAGIPVRFDNSGPVGHCISAVTAYVRGKI